MWLTPLGCLRLSVTWCASSMLTHFVPIVFAVHSKLCGELANLLRLKANGRWNGGGGGTLDDVAGDLCKEGMLALAKSPRGRALV